MTFAVQCSALYSNYLCAMILYVSTYLLKRKLLFLLFLNDYVWIEKFWNNVKFFFQIPRYIITLHELLAHTPPDHVEKKSLENARKQLEDLSRQMHDEVIYKDCFFSESAMCFSNLQISKKIFQITILNLKFKFTGNNSKQQIQISSQG